MSLVVCEITTGDKRCACGEPATSGLTVKGWGGVALALYWCVRHLPSAGTLCALQDAPGTPRFPVDPVPVQTVPDEDLTASERLRKARATLEAERVDLEDEIGRWKPKPGSLGADNLTPFAESIFLRLDRVTAARATVAAFLVPECLCGCCHAR